ncbi:hypothetical protein H4R20_001278 [Coemansia guatemalensis]|uniref:Uncharacterized protein n=1 Tax=Coemansia guatemalensis TaxID=2761395 RepID=A0A9W8HXM7_9FUNG|nr:hypothetical protein H4R20_001278 [Coemansia guatemalensis]
MYINTATALIVLASSALAAPTPRPAGTLEGVVDGVAPITAGLGVTLNNLLGFRDSGSGAAGGGGSSGGAGGAGGGGSALLGGVVDGVAPVTGGLGVTLNDLLGFK